MATKEEKKKAIRQQIIDAAKVYSSSLAGRTFLYVYGEEYFEVTFPIENFLHLTGVASKISAKDFYKNAKDSKLMIQQFYFDARHVYANAKKKLPCLIRLPENKFGGAAQSSSKARRRRDSNPRAPEGKRISSAPRYDRFDTSAFVKGCRPQERQPSHYKT